MLKARWFGLKVYFSRTCILWQIPWNQRIQTIPTHLDDPVHEHFVAHKRICLPLSQHIGDVTEDDEQNREDCSRDDCKHLEQSKSIFHRNLLMSKSDYASTGLEDN